MSAFNYPMVILLCTILVIYVTMVYGPIAAWLVELFPARIRYTSMSLPYHIGNGWFGGFLPVTSFAIVAATGNIYNGLWYPIVVASLTVCHRRPVPAGDREARPAAVMGTFLRFLANAGRTSARRRSEGSPPLFSALAGASILRPQAGGQWSWSRLAWSCRTTRQKEWSHEVMDFARLRRAVRWACRLPLQAQQHPAHPPTRRSTKKSWSRRRSAPRRCRTCRSRWPRSPTKTSSSPAPPTSSTSRAMCPACTSPTSGPGQSQVAIRGISAGQVVRDQPGVKESVGIYLDESPISVALFTPDLDLYDLDRIEVLRGPQGTLFGAGIDAGTVRYITAQPEIGEFGGSVDVDASTASTDGEFGGAAARRAQRADRRERRHARGRLLQRAARLHRFGVPGPRRRARTSTAAIAHRRAHRVPLRAERELHHHAARRLPEARDRRLSAHRRVQHPRQSLHDHRAAGRSGRARPGHADPRRHRPTNSRSRTSSSISASAIIGLTSVTSYIDRRWTCCAMPASSPAA